MGASSIAYDTIFYSDVEALSKYFPVTSHLSPATRILKVYMTEFFSFA